MRSWLINALLVVVATSIASAQSPAPSNSQNAGVPENRASEDAVPDWDKPTTLGVRLTPEIVGAMTRRMSEDMIKKYELSQDQADAVRDVAYRQILQFAHSNEKTVQQLFEYMMAQMIDNDGRFTREAAQDFAKMSKPIIAPLKDLFTQMGADMGREMSLSQRLKFTGDMTKAAAGITIFESRMKRWEAGDVGENANPFWDPGDNDPNKARPAATDPNEHPEHRRARLDAERWIEWRLRMDQDWEAYINEAVAYYQLDEKQTAAAQAILKDCQEKARAIKTDEWNKRIKDNRIARELIRRSEEKMRGPASFAIEAEFTRLQKPLVDLDEELKRRVDELPDSRQRAAARDSVRKILADRGMREPPF